MILYTSVEKNKMLRIAFGHLLAVIFLAVFGAIYEKFSHEVYSYYMIYAFFIPLVMGVLPFMSIAVFDIRIPGINSVRLWNYGVATLAVGAVFKGVLDICGTTNRLIVVYPIVAAIFIISAIVIRIRETGPKRIADTGERTGRSFRHKLGPRSYGPGRL